QWSLVTVTVFGRVLMEDEQDKCAGLVGQIQLLSDLHSRLQSLRHTPRILLRPPVSSGLVPPLRSQFQHLAEIADVLRSRPIQHALRSARDSYATDSSDLASSPRREDRKRRRVHAPESPQPYFPQEQRKSSEFPRDGFSCELLTADNMVNYIRDFNENHQSKLHLWAHIPGQNALDPPITLRFTIPDVLFVFISLNYSQAGRNVMVETVSVFGPREKKAPHTQSDFTVFRCLTQQIGKMLQQHAQLPLQCIVELLESYSELFIERCTVCERVLSMEGHIPPVIRLWTVDDKETRSGKWEPRHISCR
ncbi:hypothetical protein AX15_004653, partial [Amanita polypyramis BW_CC]